jgi:hypothetical protein
VNSAELSGHPSGPSANRPLPKVFVELAPIHHANKAIVDVDVDLLTAGGNHPCATNFGHEQVIWNLEVTNQSGWNGAATGLDPAGSVDQGHRPPGQGQLFCGDGTGWSSADHHGVI